jgi:AcrR family transcriptional regulator
VGTTPHRKRRSAPVGRGKELTRSAGKLRTRQALLEAALSLMADNRSFTSLSLREVTRRARMVPNAFYRHFPNLEALGLAILDEGGLTLRRLLRQVREAGLPDREVVRRSVEVYVRYVLANRATYLFVVRERAGGSAIIREAIRREISHFASEMAADFADFRVFPHLSPISQLMIAQIVVEMMLAAAADILDLPPGRDDLEAELIERLKRHLIVVLLGTRAWRDLK